MPEWCSAILYTNQYDAISKRQLLLGNLDIINIFKPCTLIYRTDPFISRICNMPELTYSATINKALIHCALNKDLIFPVRIVGGMNPHTKIYSIIHQRLIYLGCLINKLKHGKSNYYFLYLFYDIK